MFVTRERSAGTKCSSAAQFSVSLSVYLSIYLSVCRSGLAAARCMHLRYCCRASGSPRMGDPYRSSDPETHPKNGHPEMLLLAIGQCISSKILPRSMPTWPERPARLSSLGSSGGAAQRSNSGTSKGVGGWRRLRSLGGLDFSSCICFFPGPRRHRGVKNQAGGSVRRKSSLFQHVWHCLIYSGVNLFQFARHMALLLKTSSALPAHHCIRQASPQGWLPRAFLPFPSLPTVRAARAESTDRSLMIKLVGVQPLFMH
jgi:hypothetical protein